MERRQCLVGTKIIKFIKDLFNDLIENMYMLQRSLECIWYVKYHRNLHFKFIYFNQSLEIFLYKNLYIFVLSANRVKRYFKFVPTATCM